jgi:hypothetical protein
MDNCEEDKVKILGICTNYEWCEDKVLENGESLCIAEFDACESLKKKD